MWDGRSLSEILHDLLMNHRGKVLGLVLGLAVGLLVIMFGFWRSVFIVICVLLGYFLGKRFDEEGNLRDWWDRFFR